VANDVSIVIHAETGDTIIKLDMIKHAINELGDASERNAAKTDAAAASTGAFSAAMTIFSQDMMTSIPLVAGFSAPLAALPAIIFLVVVAVNALVFAFGTLVAIVADFIAPVSLVAGLLGALGLGFVIAAQKAAQGGGSLNEFKNKLDTLKSMFGHTATVLAHDFLPLLDRLAGAAQTALLFIDKLAKEPLDKAMHDMATKGVEMINTFVRKVADTLAHPFRLAIKLAFGTGAAGNDVAGVVAGWWDSFTKYLFGYTKTPAHQIHIGRFLAPMTQVDVQGALQPIIDWFNRHHFTKQGIEIGQDMMEGLSKSGLQKKVGAFLEQVFVAAMKRAMGQFFELFVVAREKINQEGQKLDHEVFGAIKRWATEAWDWMKQKASEAIQAVVNHFGPVKTALSIIIGLVRVFLGIVGGPVVAACESVLGVINSIVGGIHGAISAAQSLVSALGGAGSGGPGIAKGVQGYQPGSNTTGNVVVAHYHAAAGMHTIAARAEFSRFARQIGAELGAQQARLADGH
jgi:hypothetical protein